MEFTTEDAYEDASLTISRDAAIRMLEDHGVNVDELDEEIGVSERYSAWDILAWLGY